MYFSINDIIMVISVSLSGSISGSISGTHCMWTYAVRVSKLHNKYCAQYYTESLTLYSVHNVRRTLNVVLYTTYTSLCTS